MTDSALLEIDIRSVGAGYRRREWSPVDVTRAALRRIEETEDLLHSWVLIDADRALQAALQAEREFMDGVDLGPLHGIPLGVKDIIDVAGWPTRCGSRARDTARPAIEDANIVESLKRGGALILGKTATQEFAAGVISAPARNPWDHRRIPGGSSGGSAAAVAIGTVFGALGSDTGGSIRIPAAACGVTGFKPTFGDLPLQGVYPLSWSLDTAGPIARTVDDAWQLWKALKSGSRPPGPGGYPEAPNATKWRIGVPRSYFFDSLQPGVRYAVDRALEHLADDQFSIIDVEWPQAAAARACAFIINRVETAAVHVRVARDEPESFSRYGADLRVRVAAGAMIPALDYVLAQRSRPVFRESVAEVFATHRLDAIAVPTLPTSAVEADQLLVEGTGIDESLGAAWTRLTMPFNATGQPVLAIPCGLDSSGLPVGIQLAGKPGDEETLFGAGRAAETALAFASVRPLLSAPAAT